MTSIKTPEGRRLWVPVFSLALAAFIFVTTEVLPIGLLPEIAKDLGETEAFTGLLVAFYAWAVAFFPCRSQPLRRDLSAASCLWACLPCS